MTQPEWTTPLPSKNGSTPYGPASPLAPTPPAADALPMGAPVLARAVSFLIDFGGTVALTIGVVLACFSAGLSNSNGVSGGMNGLILLGFASFFVIPVASIVVNVSLSRTRGHSVGQGVMRLRLVDIRTGGRASVGSIVGRMLMLLAPGFSAMVVVAVIARTLTIGISMPAPSVVTVLAPVILLVVLVPMLRGDGRGWQDRWTDQMVVPAASRA